MRVAILAAAIALSAAAFLSGGCSTITQSEMQSLALTATYENKPVEATCEPPCTDRVTGTPGRAASSAFCTPSRFVSIQARPAI